MGPHITEALLMMEERKAEAARKLAEARTIYETYICDDRMDARSAKRLVAAAELLGIPSDELMTDAGVADSMRKIEQRRHVVGVRLLRITKRCQAIETRLNAGYASQSGEQVESLREVGEALGSEERKLIEYRAFLEYEVRDLAKFSKLLRAQPKRLEIALPAIDEVEPCDTEMFASQTDQDLGIGEPPAEESPRWEQLLANDSARQGVR